jgi:hypothetical protein
MSISFYLFVILTLQVVALAMFYYQTRRRLRPSPTSPRTCGMWSASSPGTSSFCSRRPRNTRPLCRLRVSHRPDAAIRGRTRIRVKIVHSDRFLHVSWSYL